MAVFLNSLLTGGLITCTVNNTIIVSFGSKLVATRKPIFGFASGERSPLIKTVPFINCKPAGIVSCNEIFESEILEVFVMRTV